MATSEHALSLTKEQISKLPHITAYQALAMFQQNKIILIDVHPGVNKKQASVPGAIYIPKEILSRVKLKIPKGKIIGIY